MTSDLHVVIGAGPLGTTLAEHLADTGHPVRVVTRRGSGLDHPLVEKRAADATSPMAIRAAVEGATVVYHCGNPPYTKWATMWPPLQATALAATVAEGAVYVAADNLYMYSPSDQPLRPDSPTQPSTRKGAIRATMSRDLFATDGRVTAVRGADFYGPRVEESLAGDRFAGRIVAGKAASTVGRTDLAHSYTFIDDMVAAMIAAGADDRAWGRPWHAPVVTLTQQQMADALAAAAGVPSRRVKTVGRLTLRAMGLVMPVLREVAEMHEQTDRPFTSDDSRTREVLGVGATPLPEAAARTIAWWRNRSAHTAGVTQP